jgi:hypothetical protein
MPQAANATSADQTNTANAGESAESQIAQGLQTRTATKAGESAKPAADTTPPANGTAQNSPAPSDKPNTGDGAAGDELTQLRERVKKLEAAEDSLRQKREAEDAVDSFIRERCADDLPREMLRKLFPVTSNRKELDAAGMKISQWLQDIVKSFVKAGVVQYRNIGGTSGGMNPLQFSELQAERARMQNPNSLIAEGLQRRGIVR